MNTSILDFVEETDLLDRHSKPYLDKARQIIYIDLEEKQEIIMKTDANSNEYGEYVVRYLRYKGDVGTLVINTYHLYRDKENRLQLELISTELTNKKLSWKDFFESSS